MGNCHNSIVIHAPIEKVWATIRDFYDFSWAPDLISSCEKVGDAAGDQLGAKRILNGAFHETLIGLDDLNHAILYTIDDGPGPLAPSAISNYVGCLKLIKVTADDSTLAQWTSSFVSADSSAVGELCNPVYQAGLAALKNFCEAA